MTDTHRLVAFLHARLDDDEATAQSAAEKTSPTWRPHFKQVIAAGPRHDEDPARTNASEVATHIARQDPERTLREVEAKREILADYERYAAERRRLLGGWNTDQLPPILMALAAVYADHPDYREEWRP